MLLELSDAVSSVVAEHRARILDVRRWALAAGVPVDADLLALILAARSWWRETPVTLWHRIDVYQLLRADAANWCSMHRVLIPVELPEALWVYFTYLHETAGFARGSDPLRELRRPLRCYGGLGPDGRPAGAGARRVQCVCVVPYRRRG